MNKWKFAEAVSIFVRTDRPTERAIELKKYLGLFKKNAIKPMMLKRWTLLHSVSVDGESQSSTSSDYNTLVFLRSLNPDHQQVVDSTSVQKWSVEPTRRSQTLILNMPWDSWRRNSRQLAMRRAAQAVLERSVGNMGLVRCHVPVLRRNSRMQSKLVPVRGGNTWNTDFTVFTWIKKIY